MPSPVVLMGRTWVLGVILAAALGSVLRAQEILDETAPAATGDPMEQFQQAMTAGQAALDAKEYDAAVDAFSRAIAVSDYPPEPYAGRAMALAGLKDYEAADKDFGEALVKNPESVPALVGRGEMRLELGAADLALADFQQAIEQERSNARALFGLGKAYVLLGGGDRAIRPLTRYLESEAKEEEKLAEVYRLRGQSYAAIDKMPEAMQDIQESLKIDPEDYETYAVLAAILYRQEDLVNSLRSISVAIEKYVPDPENPQPYVQGYLTKTSILIDLAEIIPDEKLKYEAYQAAIFVSEQLLQQVGEAPQYAAIRSAAMFGRGVALRMQGNLDDAIESFSVAIQLNPESAEAYFRRGICYFSIGEERLAIADFKQAGIIGIEDPRARLWEGLTYTKKGEHYEAVRAYGQAIAESDRYIPAYVNRGLTYMQLGEYDKAIDDFNEAIRLEPTAAPHFFKRGVAYAELGDQKKAADSFASAIEFDNKYVPAYRHMADSMTALGHGELADQYRSKAQELEVASEKSPPASVMPPSDQAG